MLYCSAWSLHHNLRISVLSPRVEVNNCFLHYHIPCVDVLQTLRILHIHPMFYQGLFSTECDDRECLNTHMCLSTVASQVATSEPPSVVIKKPWLGPWLRWSNVDVLK